LFVPYVLLGLVLEFMVQRLKAIYPAAVMSIGFFLIAANAYSLYNMAVRLSGHNGNDGHAVFLGELETMVRYMKDNAGSPKEVRLISDKLFRGNIFIPGGYVANKYGYNLIRDASPDHVPKGAVLYYISQDDSNASVAEKFGLPVKNSKNFGVANIYQLEN
jgi:hypothetical protein